MKPLFLESELPVDDLVRVGLWGNGKPSLSRENLQALLSGRRTELLTLENVQADGFLIKRLDVKLSLQRSEAGWVSLQAHPIHHQVQRDTQLDENEIDQLTGKHAAIVSKSVKGSDGKYKKLVFEYDPQTREFISYDPSQIQVPEHVNGVALTPEQKKAFRKGLTVELPDGTVFQHRASEPSGLRSDRKALVLSVLLDGGISYLLVRGIRSVMGEGHEQKDEYTAGFKMGLSAMERWQAQKDIPQFNFQDIERKARQNLR